MHVICCYYPFRALHWWRGLLLVFRFPELLAIFREPDSSQLPNNRTQSNLKFSHLHFGLSMWILAFMSKPIFYRKGVQNLDLKIHLIKMQIAIVIADYSVHAEKSLPVIVIHGPHRFT